MHSGVDLAEHRALDFDRVVEAGRDLSRSVLVVDDVDPADEGGFAIDDRDLAVQAAQPVAAKCQSADLAAVDQHVDPILDEFGQHLDDELTASEAIDHQSDHDSARRCAGQGRRDRFAAGIPGEDIGFQMDFCAGGIDRTDQGRKELLTAFEQSDPVAALESSHGHSSSASRGA